jgi:hypothetical protein
MNMQTSVDDASSAQEHCRMVRQHNICSTHAQQVIGSPSPCSNGKQARHTEFDALRSSRGRRKQNADLRIMQMQIKWHSRAAPTSITLETNTQFAHIHHIRVEAALESAILPPT